MSDNGFQCAADLLEAGMRIMDERGLKQCRDSIVQFNGRKQLCGVCAEGAMLLGMGMILDSPFIGTNEAIEWIADKCPGIHAKSGIVTKTGVNLSVAFAIPRLNDGSEDCDLEPHTLPEILAWLRAREPEAR